ncbi:MAG: peptidoglycan editing factor PgeF [Clostridiales bacterium]|nr:peptidoglycan editing factor PgeF [Clostridiales bacterium]
MPNNAKFLLENTKNDPVYVESSGVGVIRSERLMNEPGITHGFTTRRGGVSKPPFDSLNLGTSRDEPMWNIRANYRVLAGAYGLSYEEMALVRHEHGDKILKLDKSFCGRGIYREPLDFSDGLVTNDPGVTLMTCHADCSAFFIYDRATRSIGLAHAGWKGMYKRIGQRLAERLQAEYGADPADMVAAVGPCICENCFEVELELAQSFAREFDCPDIYREGTGEKADKGYVALQAAAVIQLMDAGIPRDNISLMRLCTMEEKELFYSYRRDGKNTGSMAAFLKLV